MSQHEFFKVGTTRALIDAIKDNLNPKADKTGTYSTLIAGGTTPNSVTDVMLVQTGGVLSVLTATRTLVEGDDFTFQNGWYNTSGNFNSHAMYRTCVVPVNSNAKMVVTTAANSAAPIAVYFSGEPSSSTALGFEHADYPASYGTAQFTDVELTIPAGTKYVAVNKSLNGGFVPEFSIVLTDSAMRLTNIEDELGKCVSDTENITELLTIERTLVDGVDYNVSGGYYGNTAELTPNASYVNTVIDYEAGNRYIVSTYANSAAKIAMFYSGTPSSATFVGAQSADYLPDYALTQFVDFELVVPDGTSKIAINCNINGYLAIKVEGIEQRFIALENEVNELQEANAFHKGKKILYMGDSITQLGRGTRGWPGMFHTMVSGDNYVNTAVIGARWCDYDDTVLDGNPVFGGEDDNHNNTISNQVEQIVRGKDESDPNYSKVDEYEDFDAIIIAAGTNDVNTDDGLDTQFVVGGVPVALDDLDRMTWGGAMRYAYERLRNLYPDAAFFYCSPIQGAEMTRPYSVITEKRERMRDICDRISDVTFVDTFNCGVCGVYELANTEGRDLIDGLHPLATGAMKIAKYNANAFINFYNFDRG